MLSPAPTPGDCATEKLKYSADGGNAMILRVASHYIYFFFFLKIQFKSLKEYVIMVYLLPLKDN